MATKTFKSRIQNKHDTEAHWSAATNFRPLAGELIIYDEDDTHSTPRLKIGNGNTLVNNLPFIPTVSTLGQTGQLKDGVQDTTHRLVTDTEKSAWNSKQTQLTNDQLNAVNSGITATKVSLTSENGVTIETEFRSGENVRIAFVINRNSGSLNKGLSFIYTNGIISRGESWLSTDRYDSNKTIKFTASDNVEISLKAIRVYNTALTSDQILNNYILYRDSIEEMTSIYDRNDIYTEGTTAFNPDKMMSRVPVMIVTGDVSVLENTSDKNTQITVDIEYYNMQDPTRNFSMVNAAMRPQGTSSMGYPKKNFRIYTKKIDDTVLYDYTGKIVKDKLY